MAEEADATPPQKSKVKTIITLGGLLIAEAALIVGAMSLFSGPPEVQASEGLEAVAIPEEEKIVEQLVVDARFPNSKRGRTYLYQTEVYVQVKRKNQQLVADQLDQFGNEIKAELGAIWRTSDPASLEEPRLETLTRKVYALLRDRFGIDQDTEEPIVTKVVIVMGTGLRIDG